MFVCTCVFLPLCVHVCIYLCMAICMYACVCVHVCTHLCVHVCVGASVHSIAKFLWSGLGSPQNYLLSLIDRGFQKYTWGSSNWGLTQAMWLLWVRGKLCESSFRTSKRKKREKWERWESRDDSAQVWKVWLWQEERWHWLGQDPLSCRQTTAVSSRQGHGPGEAGLTCHLADSASPGLRRVLSSSENKT